MPPKKLFIWQGYWQGGTGRITLELARYFHARGIDVTLGAYSKNHSVTLPQLIIPEPRFLPASFRSFYASLIWQIKYSHLYHATYAHTLGLWKTRHNLSFVHDAADLDQKLSAAPDLIHKAAYFCWKTLYLHLCLKHATLVFAATDAFAQYLLRNNINVKKIIPSGSFYDDSIFIFTRRPRPQLPYRLVFVGDTNDPVKNMPYMIKNFYKNNNYHVTILGGQEKKSDYNFTYYGYQPPAYVQKILTQSDLFIMPSFSEGFSVALLEAAASGLPCLVNRDTAPSELKDTPIIIPFNLDTPIHQLIAQVMKKYEYHAQKSSVIQHYSQSNILQKEYEIIAPYLTPTP